jgi:hypothetical protein
MPIDLSTCRPGDILHLANGHTATVRYIHRDRDGGQPKWVRAIYHHPTDAGWNRALGDWQLDGTKDCQGTWPWDSMVIRVEPAKAQAVVSRTIVVMAGETIRDAAARMVLIAGKEKVTVHADFNGVSLAATPQTMVEDLVDTYHREIDIASDRYRTFPKYPRT